MHRLTTRLLVLAALAFAVACGSDGGTSDGQPRDPNTDPATDPTPNPLEPPTERGTTYYVIRHTERDPGEDPPINEEGEMRAERLADALENAGIDEIVTTLFIRGQQSGQPLSDRTGAPIVVAPFERTTWPETANNVAAWQIEREVPGATYLMIGHSGGYNTRLLLELGAPNVGTLAERYQDLVILVREPDGSARLSILQYGGPSSLDAP